MSEEKPKKIRNKKVSNAKTNGRNFQNKIRDFIKELYDLEDHEVRCATGYEQGIDIKITSPDAKEKVEIGIECKNHTRLNIFGAIRQVEKNYEKEGYLEPAVFFKQGGQRGRCRTWVCIDIEYFAELVKRANL